MSKYFLLSEGHTNAKTVKNSSEYLSFILYLSPADLSGHEVCPGSSAGCRAACLNTAGRGAFSNVQSARLRRTKLLFEDRVEFMRQLTADLRKAEFEGALLNKKVAVRLNGTSDLNWRGLGLDMTSFKGIQFYDYTKMITRLYRQKWSPIPNYHLTFSLSEENLTDAGQALHLGFNVAAVFNELPDTFLGYPVISGDDTDLRFTDPSGCIVGLKAKGKARRDESGFVIRD